MFSGTRTVLEDVQQSVNPSHLTVLRGRFSVRCVKYLCATVLGLVLLSVTVDSTGQTRKRKKAPQKSDASLADRMAKAKADLVAAANEYKASLEKLLALQESDVKAASSTVEKHKQLLAQSIMSKKELEESERALSSAQYKVAQTKKQIGESENLIAEVTAEEQLVKVGPGTYQSTAALIRYNGTARWMLTDAAKVQSFFSFRFNHALPISAFGQTAVHDQLGFDHRNSIDVAVSPDSAEGQALMTYLRSSGIPFIAFRHAVRGSATGAHIHIGYPSRRAGK